MEGFEVAAGSVVGKDHRRSGRNNQDAYYIASTDDHLIVLVADGCGSSSHSEVGAQLGVRFAARIIAKKLERHGQGGYLWINHALVGELNLLKRWLGGEAEKAVRDYLLFTLVGAIITPESAEFFAFGDGVLSANGRVIQAEFGNVPPYPAYQLLEGLDIPAEQLAFQVYAKLPTAELQSFAIGTDGVSDLIKAGGKPLPGKPDKTVLALDEMTSDQFFSNPDALRRYLTLVNRETVRIQGGELVRDLGHLRDDTTLIVGRRAAEEEK